MILFVTTCTLIGAVLAQRFAFPILVVVGIVAGAIGIRMPVAENSTMVLVSIAAALFGMQLAYVLTSLLLPLKKVSLKRTEDAGARGTS